MRGQRRGVQRVILHLWRNGMRGGKVCSEHFEGSESACFGGYAGDGERKNVFYVFVAQEFVSLRLLFVSLAALYVFRVNGDVRNFADAFGDAFTLVVSTLELARPGKGKGNDAIDALEELGVDKIFGHESSQVNADFGAVVEF